MIRRLTLRRETWPIRGTFTLSRGSKTAAEVVVVELAEEGVTGRRVGRGECVPYRRYGETLDSVEAQIAGLAPAIEDGLDRAALQRALPAGAARNALDCALWDLAAKRVGPPVWRLAGLDRPAPVATAYTLTLAAPEAMAEAAAAAAAIWPLLKLKLGAEGSVERVRAVRAAAPAVRLIVDPNESWSFEQLGRDAPALAEFGVEMIEQPLPAGRDEALAGYDGTVPLCADESCHDVETLPALRGRYRMVNIKLDKTGGLTEALRLRAAALEAGFDIMVGCMVATSLGIAPAVLVAQGARVVDLDGALLLERDRIPGLRLDGASLCPPEPALWG